MKKIVKQFCHILAAPLTLLFIFSLPQVVQAADPRGLVSDELVNVGKMYYEMGDRQRAIHELTKALLVDPTNKEAVDLLAKMGAEDILYTNGNPDMLQVSEYVRGYKDRIAALEQENVQKDQQNQSLQEAIDGLKDSISGKEQENQFLLSKIKETQGQADALAAQNKSLSNNLEQKSHDEKGDVVRLNMTLYELKQKMSDNLDAIKQKEEQLSTLESKLNNTEKDLQMVQAKHESDVKQIEQQYEQYKQHVAKNEAMKREKFMKLSDLARKKLLEAEAAKDKLLFTEYKLTDRESKLLEQSRRIDELKRELRSLQEEMAHLQLKSKPQVNVPANRLPSAEPDKEALIQRQEQLIEELKTKLAAAQTEMDSLENSVKKGNEKDIDALKQQLDDKNKSLQATQSTLEEKETNYHLLEERLKDTQKRLELVEKIILEKDEQVRDLEQQLGQTTEGGQTAPTQQ